MEDTTNSETPSAPKIILEPGEVKYLLSILQYGAEKGIYKLDMYLPIGVIVQKLQQSIVNAE